MKRAILITLSSLFAFALGWLGVWSYLMSDDVARVKTSVDHHTERLRGNNHSVRLKADAVYATGFPFRFRVAVERATLSMVEGDETFAVSLPIAYLSATDAKLGTYQLTIPQPIEALYAMAGAAPEEYRVTASPLPEIYFSAQDGKTRCGALTGVRCIALDTNAPFASYGVTLPASLTLHMELGTESRDAAFTLMPTPVPIYQPIPEDVRYPLQIFIGVLREALVFKTGDKASVTQ